MIDIYLDQYGDIKEPETRHVVDVLDNIWSADWADISDIQLVPGFRMSDDVWILPQDWSAWGAGRRIGARTIDFAKHLPPGWEREDERTENAVRRLKRMAALLFTRTLRITKKVKAPKQPRSWAEEVNLLARIAGAALPVIGLREHTTTCPDGEVIFGSLTDDQFTKLALRGPKSLRERLFPRLNALRAYGEFDDWPAADVAAGPIGQCTTKTFKPFSDDFTAILSDSALWISEVLGPDILACWSGVCELQTQKITTSYPTKARAQRDRYVLEFARRAKIGDAEFKYHIKVRTSDHRKIVSRVISRWSEMTPTSVRYLAIKLQDAHATILALCMAPRNGELASLPRDCLREYCAGGLIRGLTFKLSETEEERDWPIPGVAVKIVRQQIELAEILDPGGEKLFVCFRSDRGRQNARDKLLIKPRAFTDCVYLPNGRSLTSLCSGNVHSHRIRKTVARLAALALVGANQILFDILGHRDPEMTLNYILADPHLQEEMQQIAKEAAMAIATTAFDDVDANGGPAAAAVAQIAGRLKVRSGADELDEKSLVLAATLLSQNGRVTLVKKGVLCTKTSGQMGECVRSIGVPDIGNCKATCMHRLELAAAKSDHKRAIEQALAEFTDTGPMMMAWWQAQILTHLIPFPDLRAEMLEDGRVKEALADIDQTFLEQLWSKSPAEAERQLEEMA